MSVTAVEIVAVLNGITRMGIAWQEYGALIDRARVEGREVTLADVKALGDRARSALDDLLDAIDETEGLADPRDNLPADEAPPNGGTPQ